MHLHLSYVLDLCKESTRRALGITLSEVASSDWQAASRPTATQALGQRAYQEGVEAIMFPSRLDVGLGNIVVYPDNLAGGSVMRIVEDDSSS